MADHATSLNLSTTGEVERSTFTVDDKLYQFRHRDELSLSDMKRADYGGKSMKRYFDSEDEPTAQADANAKGGLDMAVHLITVDFPDAVLAELSDQQKLEILAVWKESAGLADDDDAD